MFYADTPHVDASNVSGTPSMHVCKQPCIHTNRDDTYIHTCIQYIQYIQYIHTYIQTYRHTYLNDVKATEQVFRKVMLVSDYSAGMRDNDCHVV